MMKVRLIKLIPLCIFLGVLISSSTPDKLKEELFTRLQEYQQNHPEEKIFIHTNKYAYAAGDTVWFKVYLRNADDQRWSKLSAVVHVDLIDPKDSIIGERLIYAKRGFSAAEFAIADSSMTGRYRLRAYTKWQRNFTQEFFESDLFVSSVTSEKILSAGVASDSVSSVENSKAKGKIEVTVDFLPEGGELVDGITTQVAFVARSKNGQPLMIRGKLIDQNEVSVTAVKSNEYGLGTTFVRTVEQQPLTLLITEINGEEAEQKIPFPKGISKGYVITAVQRDDKLITQVKGQKNGDLANCSLVISQNDKLLDVFKLDPNAISDDFSLGTHNLRAGILKLTLFDANNRPRNERLVYINNKTEKAEVKLNLSKKRFKKRERIDLSYLVNKGNEKNVGVAASLAVVAGSDVKDQRVNIISEMLLCSNIDIPRSSGLVQKCISEKGVIDDKLMDLVLLTHGWRRFTWQDVLRDVKVAK